MSEEETAKNGTKFAPKNDKKAGEAHQKKTTKQV